MSMRSLWSRIAAGLAIAAVAAVTGTISYTHIFDLTRALHQSVMVAQIMPIGIDGLVIVGAVVLLQAGPGERWLGWLGIGPGVAISLFANIESGIRYGWLAAVWAGIPAVSFALASFILEHWLASQAAATAPAPGGAAKTAVAAVPVPVPAPMPGGVSGSVPASVSGNGVSPVPVPRVRTVAASRSPGTGRASKPKTPEKIFSVEIERGELPSLREVMRRARCGADRARSIRDELSQGLEATVNA